MTVHHIRAAAQMIEDAAREAALDGEPPRGDKALWQGVEAVRQIAQRPGLRLITESHTPHFRSSGMIMPGTMPR